MGNRCCDIAGRDKDPKSNDNQFYYETKWHTLEELRSVPKTKKIVEEEKETPTSPTQIKQKKQIQYLNDLWEYKNITQGQLPEKQIVFPDRPSPKKERAKSLRTSHQATLRNQLDTGSGGFRQTLKNEYNDQGKVPKDKYQKKKTDPRKQTRKSSSFKQDQIAQASLLKNQNSTTKLAEKENDKKPQEFQKSSNNQAKSTQDDKQEKPPKKATEQIEIKNLSSKPQINQIKQKDQSEKGLIKESQQPQIANKQKQYSASHTVKLESKQIRMETTTTTATKQQRSIKLQ